MWLEFGEPHYLWALLPLALHAWWMGRRLQLLSPARRRMALGLRLVLLALLLGALAQARTTRQSDQLKVIFLVDQSESVPPAQREYARAFVEDAMKQMGARDQTGVIMFGGDASVERAPSRDQELAPFMSVVDRSRTNLGEAISLALAMFTGESQKRIVILSDGNENTGDAADAARAAAAAGVALDFVPLEYHNRNDVVLEKALVESRVSLEEPFDVRVIASSRGATEAQLSILQDGRLIGRDTVRLEADKKNVFVVSTQVRDAGFHTFEVLIEAEGDQIAENNRGYAFTYGQGEPRVLLVDGDARPSDALPAMLLSEKIGVERVTPEGLPHSLRDLQSYDGIIFNNVGAGDVTADQMRLIEQAVHALGIGFMMIGGEHSFGAGGWKDSPIERILPVSMDIKNEKILPQGALALVIHTCEIPQGNMWAEKIALAALDTLSPRDLMGVLYFGYPGGESWLFPLQEAGNKGRMRSLIQSIQPGDMPTFDPTLQMAYDGLMSTNASARHIIIISDGDPAQPNPALVRQIQAAQITISTVLINPHSPRDRDMMKKLAQEGGGNFYDVVAYNKLPQIFIKEAATIRKSLIFNEPFLPVISQGSPLLAGLGQGYPVLGGYVGSSPKELADVPLTTDKGDPLLAHWRHGVGKTVAFTSDAKERWGAQWVGWGEYGKFWTQAVRWVLRAPVNPNYQIQMDVEGGVGRITVDAIDAAGNFQNFLDIAGQVVSPELEPLEVALRQVGPGRYEGEFPVERPGTYMLGANARAQGAEGADLITGGTALSYSPEFRDARSNTALLGRLADLTRPWGRRLDEQSFVFAHNLPSRTEPKPLWPLLLSLALVVLLLDIFVRRVLVDWRDLRLAAATGWGWVEERVLGRRKVDAATGGLLEIKRQVRERESEAQQRETREEFLASLKQVRAEGDSPVAQAGPRAEPRSRPASPVDRAAPRGATGSAPAGGEGSYTDQLLRARQRARGNLKKD